MTWEAASADTVAVMHCVGWGQCPNPQEVHGFKWEYSVGFVQHLVWM
jgi:hypothetical protein